MDYAYSSQWNSLVFTPQHVLSARLLTVRRERIAYTKCTMLSYVTVVYKVHVYWGE
ncbi:hypothetical protein M501DRAFT_997044 [Patellaria atrata CBS 101060]|uniref:Uncharacterized protein n=1 Tax=Patellaria atrata CBS 101060 TaxID=1346257 RepID=A0A9P4S4Y1_9PEZI|nr:hypothetical protein M501DRAFT_997044 [Patellaria atrata CBS 101060]